MVEKIHIKSVELYNFRLKIPKNRENLMYTLYNVKVYLSMVEFDYHIVYKYLMHTYTDKGKKDEIPYS